MGSAALNTAIENTFSVSWGATTPVSYDGVPFIVPETAWVHLEVWDGKSAKASLGTGVQLRRTSGTVYITVYGVLKQGSKPARALADQAAAIFRDLQVSNIIFYEPTIKRMGEVYHSGSGNRGATEQWFEVIVSVPFIYNQYI